MMTDILTILGSVALAVLIIGGIIYGLLMLYQDKYREWHDHGGGKDL